MGNALCEYCCDGSCDCGCFGCCRDDDTDDGTQDAKAAGQSHTDDGIQDAKATGQSHTEYQEFVSIHITFVVMNEMSAALVIWWRGLKHTHSNHTCKQPAI